MHKELRKIRIKMKYSVREFAELLGLNPATYQGYEYGRRQAPQQVIDDAKAAYRRDVAFFKELPKRVDEAIKKEFPLGIKSDVRGD